MNSGVTDSHRTMREITNAMSSILYFIQFEGEDPGMFVGDKLPTLDTSIWWNGLSLVYEFFEKPTVPNKVLQKDTALAVSSVRSSLNQEVVRRLLNCSQNLEMDRKTDILSTFAQKLLNSGFSVASSRLILVHGCTRYVELVRKSKLPHSAPEYRPLHYDKNFNLYGRKLKKYLEKSNWYEPEIGHGTSWRSKLPTCWKGSKPLQQKLPGFKYSTVLQVQNTKGSRLVREIAKVEPRLAKLSGYHVKLIEKGGKPLSKCFSKDFSEARCNRIDCQPCLNPAKCGPTLCKVKNVVYQAVCSCCDARFKRGETQKHEGRYVGLTARTLYERANEHVNALKNFELDSFMWKHWALKHFDDDSPPNFWFEVLKCH